MSALAPLLLGATMAFAQAPIDFDGASTPGRPAFDAAQDPPRDAFSRQLIAEGLAKLKSPERGTRIAGLHLLSGRKALEHADAIAALLDDPDELARNTAIETLGEVGAKAYAGRVAAFLKDKKQLTRSKAVGALLSFESIEHIDALADETLALLASEFMGRRTFDIEVLSILRPQSGSRFGGLLAERFAAGLAHREPVVRRAAIDALTVLGARSAADKIAALVHDNDPNLRAAALLSLGKLQARERTDELAAIASGRDPDLRVRRAAAQALQLMGADEKLRQIFAGLLAGRTQAVRKAAVALPRYQIQRNIIDPRRVGTWPYLQGGSNRAVTVLALDALERVLAARQAYGLSDAETLAISSAAALGRRAMDMAQAPLSQDIVSNFNPFVAGYLLSWLARQPATGPSIKALTLEIESAHRLGEGVGNGVYSATFHAAVSLIGLVDAAEAGEGSASPMALRLARALEKSRSDAGIAPFFPYYSQGTRGGNAQGAAARSVACQYALWRYYRYAGQSAAAAQARKNMDVILAAYLKYLPDVESTAMELGGKAEPHSGPSGIASYYHLFSLHYAAKILGVMGAQAPPGARDALRLSVLKMQDAADGSWRVSEGPAYGTAMALLVLLDLE